MALDPKTLEALKLDAATLDALRAKHGPDLHLLRWSDGDETVAMIFKRPTKDVFRKFTTSRGKGRDDAPERLVYDCLAWPDAAVATSEFDRRHGLVLTFGNKLVRLAGLGMDMEVEADPL